MVVRGRLNKDRNLTQETFVTLILRDENFQK